MEDHPHTHPIHLPMGIAIPTAALGTTPRSGPHMFMPIIMWEMCRASSAVLHQLAYIDVMRVLLVQAVGTHAEFMCLRDYSDGTNPFIYLPQWSNYQAILQ